VLSHALAPIVPAAAHALGLTRRLGSGVGGVALTFDDGPHPEGTPAVLEALARADAHATFFVIGEQVQRRPQLVARILSEGHVVALHGYRHHLQLRLRANDVAADLARGMTVVGDAAGESPRLHRPPYGIYSPAGLRFARASGLRPLLWSRWGKDWRKFTTPERIARRAIDGAIAGDVILLHDSDFYSAKKSHLHTVEALGLILTELRAREIATVLPV
jgi:peptidoglycan-N-acetylglucosamine deacetylase